MLPLFDVGLSFAGEQRDYVRRVSRALQQSHKLRVFYDEEQTARLSASHINKTLQDIYRFQSKWVVIFCSQAYVEKKWPSFEGQTILAKAIENPEGYLILGKFDQAELPGWPDTYHHSNLEKMSPNAFAKLIADTIKQKPKVDRDFIFFKIAMQEYPAAHQMLLNELCDISDPETAAGRMGLETYGFLSYNLACVESHLAEVEKNPNARRDRLTRAMRLLNRWIDTPGMHPQLSQAEARVYINTDDDLLFLRKADLRMLKQRLPAFFSKKVTISRKPSGQRGRCLDANTMVLTPSGAKMLRDLGEGAWVMFAELNPFNNQVATTVRDVKSVVEPIGLRINENIICSLSQRFYVEGKGWTTASNMRAGMRLLQGDGTYRDIFDLVGVPGPFELVSFTTNHSAHNFIANGYVCHNVKK